MDKNLKEDFEKLVNMFIEGLIMYASTCEIDNNSEFVNFIKSNIETEDGSTYLLTLAHVSGPRFKYKKIDT